MGADAILVADVVYLGCAVGHAGGEAIQLVVGGDAPAAGFGVELQDVTVTLGVAGIRKGFLAIGNGYSCTPNGSGTDGKLAASARNRRSPALYP